MTYSKTMFAFVGLLAAAAIWADCCCAQGRGRGGMRGLSGQQQDVSEMALLSIKEVIEHLKNDFELGEEEAEKIGEMTESFGEEINEKRRAMMQGFREMEQEERDKAVAEIQQISKELNSESFKKVRKLLDRNQLKRLGELKMQRLGSAIMQDGLVQEVLGFSDSQIEKMAGLRKSFDEKRESMMADFRADLQDGGREGMREAMSEMRASTEELGQKLEKDLGDVLTDEQKEKLVELKGEIFDFPQRRRGGRREFGD